MLQREGESGGGGRGGREGICLNSCIYQYVCIIRMKQTVKSLHVSAFIAAVASAATASIVAIEGYTSGDSDDDCCD